MFDFSILISALIAICIFYFTLYITLKKEIGDLTSSSNKPSENYLKINNRKNKLKILNIITIFLIFSVITLYLLPNIVTEFKEMNLTSFSPITFSDIGNFLMKLVPFKKSYFSNFNFTFSYITEMLLSITVTIFLFKDFNVKSNLILIISIFALIWINNFISLFLSQCIVKCFVFISIIFNLFLYIVVPFIIIVINMTIDDVRKL